MPAAGAAETAGAIRAALRTAVELRQKKELFRQLFYGNQCKKKIRAGIILLGVVQ